MRDEQNPFLAGLGKVASIPINAARLPFRLLNTIVGSERANNEVRAGNLRSDLRQQVTGESIPFDTNANLLKTLTLGLAPGSESARLDPSTLTAQQQEKFNQLSPLQQRLLTAKRSADFADLMSDDTLFQDRAQETDAGKVNQALKAGQITKEQAAKTEESLFPSPKAATLAGQAAQDGQNGFLSPSQIAQAQAKALSRDPVVVGNVAIDGETGEVLYDARDAAPGIGPLVLKNNEALVVGNKIVLSNRAPIALGQNTRLLTPDGSATLVDAEGPPLLLAPNTTVADDAGNVIFRSEPEPDRATLGADQVRVDGGVVTATNSVPRTETGKVNADGANSFLSPEEVAAEKARVAAGSFVGVPESGVLFDPVKRETVFKNDISPAKAQKLKTELDDKIFNSEQTLAAKFQSVTSEMRERSSSFQAAAELFGLDDPRRVDPKIIRELKNGVLGVDLKNRSASAVRDIALMFAFMRTLEPGGIFREGEQQMIRVAREKYGLSLSQEIALNLIDGELLTDQQRAELFESMQSVYRGAFANYDSTVANFRKAALRTRLNGSLKIDPKNAVLDSLGGMREALSKKTGQPGAQYPAADEEVEVLLSDLFEKEFGSEPDTYAEFSRFANSMGFRLAPRGE